MNKKIVLITSLLTCFVIIVPSITLGVLSSTYKKHNNSISPFNTEYNNEYYIDLFKHNQKLKSIVDSNTRFNNLSKKFGHYMSLDWLNSLNSNDWNRDKNGNILDLYCSSETQALALYVNCWGDFWNIELHQNKVPTNKEHVMQGQICNGEVMKIRGSDYKYIESSLQRSCLSVNTITYHGVEFMENEFYDQLKDYITGNDEEGYDYSNCVGKTITSYGFISTTLNYNAAITWSSGWDWINYVDNPPLREPFIFKIFIPKNLMGVAYISDYNLNGTNNVENQIIINRNSKFKILKWYRENGINIFEVELI